MGARAVYGGEEALAVECNGELEVVFGRLDRGEAQAGFGGVLEMRAHVCYVEDGGHGGGLWDCGRAVAGYGGCFQ